MKHFDNFGTIFTQCSCAICLVLPKTSFKSCLIAVEIDVKIEEIDKSDTEEHHEYGSSGNKDIEDNDILTGTRQTFDSDSVNDIIFGDISYMFSCTSSSSKRFKPSIANKPETVTYEKCLFNHGSAFSEGSGEFIAKEKGVYDFSVTFLMKTDYEGSVKG